ncbi:MAG: YdeI family protein [Vicinamibacteria bacterium]
MARAFATPAEFRRWLQGHPGERELLVSCRKVQASRRGVTYRQALDEALCVGWIDGVRRAVDAESFSVRFTPRKPKSAWSAVNVRRFEELRAEGRVRPSGLRAFEARVEPSYSYENRPRRLAPALAKRFRAQARAWHFFRTQPPWYQRTCAFWVMSAKRPETRERRLAQLVACSEAGEPIAALKRPTGRPGG